MMLVNMMILCEGNTDQVLLGAYLSSLHEVKFEKHKYKDLFAGETIYWYSDETNKLIGIWSVGGNDFTKAISKIMNREYQEHLIESIVVVTDHDDETACSERPKAIASSIEDSIDLVQDIYTKDNAIVNEWIELKFANSFAQNVTIKYFYMLVPFDTQGALETYMLEALSENKESMKLVIEKVKQFIKDFDSDEYLCRRREKIKAELGVSVSIFNPDRMFDTMIEIIDSVDWTTFDLSKEQFKVFNNL